MLNTAPSLHRKLIAVALALAWTLSSGVDSFAQQQKDRAPTRRVRQAPKAPTEKPAQEKTKDSPLPRITPEEQLRVDKLLRQWEEQTKDVRSLKGRFGRITKNATFKTETKDTGTFVYKAPDQGKFWVDRKGDPEKWVCTGKAILQFDDEKKQVKRLELPPELQGEHIRKGPMPFLFGMSADELRRRYWLRIYKEQASQVWLEAYPLQRDDAANFKKALLILNKKTFLPQAIKLFDPNGKDSRVYVLSELKRNIPILPTEFNVPLFGWKVVDMPAGARRATVPMPKARSAKSAAPKRSSVRK